MSERRPTIRVTDEQLVELAGLLSRGEVIPQDLEDVLAAIGRDPEELARLEAHRAWWSLLGEASESDQAEPEAMLVILIHPTAEPEPRWEILASEGWIRSVLELDSSGRVRTALAVEGRARPQRFDVALKRKDAELEIELRKLAGRAKGVQLEVTTPEGEPHFSTLTDARGKARIPIGDAVALRLVFRWPAQSALARETL